MMADRKAILGKGRLQNSVRKDADRQGVAPGRAMRWVSAAAFFEFLNCAEADGRIHGYAIKGGFAVELRHARAARTSEDIDLILAGKTNAIGTLHDLLPGRWDAFEFAIKSDKKREHVTRVEVQARFNNTAWGTLKIDVIDDTIQDVERVPNIAIDRFGLPEPRPVACLSRDQQIAEWIHCTTRPPEINPRNRAKNIVDIYLFDVYAATEDEAVRAACVKTFARERTHAMPTDPEFPETWTATVVEVISDTDLEINAEDVIAHVKAYIRRLSLGTQ